MEQQGFDVLVVGAGASGLMAALECALAGKKVAVIEARDRPGGRILTLSDPAFGQRLECGAEFVHGKLELTQLLLKKAGATTYEVTGDIYQKTREGLHRQKDFIANYRDLHQKLKRVKHDMTVQEFIDQNLSGPQYSDTALSLRSYVEGYYAAKTSRASTLALREDLSGQGDQQFRIENGYGVLVEFLYNECRDRNVEFYFSSIVTMIGWEKDKVQLNAGRSFFHGKKLLLTVPMGVLTSNSIAFVPGLQHQMLAAGQLGFGGVVKTLLQFGRPFWRDGTLKKQDKGLEKLGFVFSQAEIPTWWTSYPREASLLTGWSGGPHAERIKSLEDEAIIEKALGSLAEIFEVEAAFLARELKSWRVANWVTDPFCRGGYSFDVVDGNRHKRVLKQPVLNTIFFAGEALHEGPEIGTVEAALVTGREAAHRLIAGFRS